MKAVKSGRFGLRRWFVPMGSEISDFLESIEQYRDGKKFGPCLLYAGTCPKCRFLSRCVVVLSLNSIRRISLDPPQWQEFYAKLPEARGYPVLIADQRLTFGWLVFLGVPLLVLRSWFMHTTQTGKGSGKHQFGPSGGGNGSKTQST